MKSSTSKSVNDIIKERNSTHGDFKDNARISQKLKELIVRNGVWDDLSDVQKESLEMICFKLSRIISGKSCEPDHWKDIAGYATLAEQEILDALHKK
jgi:hypothetical protein